MFLVSQLPIKSSTYSLLFLIDTLCNEKIEIVRVKKLHKKTRREKALQKVCDFPWCAQIAIMYPRRTRAFYWHGLRSWGSRSCTRWLDGKKPRKRFVLPMTCSISNCVPQTSPSLFFPWLEIVRLKKLHKMPRRDKASQKVTTSPPSNAGILSQRMYQLNIFSKSTSHEIVSLFLTISN